MISLVTVKGIRENTLKRLTKSDKNHAGYFIFHNHLFFSNISKKGMQTIRTLPKKQSLSASLFFLPFLMMCAGWEKCAKTLDSSPEPGGLSAWRPMQNFTSPKSHLFFILDMQLLARNRNAFKIIGCSGG